MAFVNKMADAICTVRRSMSYAAEQSSSWLTTPIVNTPAPGSTAECSCQIFLRFVGADQILKKNATIGCVLIQK